MDWILEFLMFVIADFKSVLLSILGCILFAIFFDKAR